MNGYVELPTSLRPIVSFPFDIYDYRLHEVPQRVFFKAGLMPAGIAYMPWIVRMLKLSSDLQLLSIREEMAREERERTGEWPQALVGTWRWDE